MASSSNRCSFPPSFYTPTKGTPSRGAWLPGPSAGRGGAACRPCALLRGSGSPPPILVSVCTQVGF